MTDTSPIIELENIEASYEHTNNLESVALAVPHCTIQAGEHIVILGANGSGKSTFAHICAGLLIPSQGTVRIFGMPLVNNSVIHNDHVQSAIARIGMVWQNPIEHTIATTVEDDIAFTLENLGLPREEIELRIHKALSYTGLLPYRHSAIQELSGGLQQRLAIAQAWCKNPELIIFDEPTAMLDPQARKDFLTLLEQLQREGTTTIMVTHRYELLHYAQRAIILQHGRVVADIPAKRLHDNPQLAQQYGIISNFQPTISPDEKIDQRTNTTLQISHLTIHHRNYRNPLLEDISFTCKSGELTVITGNNGAGKSSLLSCMTGIAMPQHGEVLLNGTNLRETNGQKAARTLLGFVPQHPQSQLFEATCEDDILFAPKQLRMSVNHSYRRLHDIAEHFGISHILQRSPFTISGGQQRKVAIAGATIMNPHLVIFDEPYAYLDAAGIDAFQELITRLLHKGVGVIVTTHDIERISVPINQHIDIHDGTLSIIHHDSAQTENNVTTTSAPSHATVHQPYPQTTSKISKPSTRSFAIHPTILVSANVTMIIAMFTATTPLAMSACSVYLLFFLGYAQYRNSIVLRRILPAGLLLAPMALLMLFMNAWVIKAGTPVLTLWGNISFTDQGISHGVLIAIRFWFAMILGIATPLTLSSSDMLYAAMSWTAPLRWLHYNRQSNDIGIIITLVQRTIPLLFDDVQRINQAQRARGGFANNSLSGRARAYRSLTVPVITSMLHRVNTLSTTLAYRCYTSNQHRTPLQRHHIHFLDIATIILVVLILGILYYFA